MSFEPKTKVELDPPKDDIISLDYLSKCDGELHCGSYSSTQPVLISVKQAPTQTTLLMSPSRAPSLMWLVTRHTVLRALTKVGRRMTYITHPDLRTNTVISKSSPERMLLALWDSPPSSLRSAVLIGLISRTSTRRCSTTGSLSSASATTSKARSRALRTRDDGWKALLLMSSEKKMTFWFVGLGPFRSNCKNYHRSVSVMSRIFFAFLLNAEIRPLPSGSRYALQPSSDLGAERTKQR